MTSLLREEIPVPMAEAASATTTSCPASAAARATASPTTPAPTTSTCIRAASLTDVIASSCPARSQACADCVNLPALPAIHALLPCCSKNVDGRDKPGHDEEGLPP